MSVGGPDEVELKRLHWNCRRGLLELDITLGRFLARYAARLDCHELVALKQLLELGDNELWDLVSGRRNSDRPQHAGVLRKLREN